MPLPEWEVLQISMVLPNSWINYNQMSDKMRKLQIIKVSDVLYQKS